MTALVQQHKDDLYLTVIVFCTLPATKNRLDFLHFTLKLMEPTTANNSDN